MIACKSTWKHLVILFIQCIQYCQACKFHKFCKSFQCFKSLQLANYQSAACKGGRRQGRSLKIYIYILWHILVCWLTRAMRLKNYLLKLRRYSFITKEMELEKEHSGIFSLISVSLWLLAHILEALLEIPIWFWKARLCLQHLAPHKTYKISPHLCCESR